MESVPPIDIRVNQIGAGIDNRNGMGSHFENRYLQPEQPSAEGSQLLEEFLQEETMSKDELQGILKNSKTDTQ